MKRVELVTTITCDLCGRQIEEYELAALNKAGFLGFDKCSVNYGCNLMISMNNRQVEHICKECIKKVLVAIADNI